MLNTWPSDQLCIGIHAGARAKSTPKCFHGVHTRVLLASPHLSVFTQVHTRVILASPRLSVFTQVHARVYSPKSTHPSIFTQVHTRIYSPKSTHPSIFTHIHTQLFTAPSNCQGLHATAEPNAHNYSMHASCTVRISCTVRTSCTRLHHALKGGYFYTHIRLLLDCWAQGKCKMRIMSVFLCRTFLLIFLMTIGF